MSSNLLRFGFTSSKCSDGEPSNKRKNDGEGSIQAGESSAQSEGSDKATSSRSYECKRTRNFLGPVQTSRYRRVELKSIKFDI